MDEKLRNVEKCASGLAGGGVLGACHEGRASKGRPYRSLSRKQQQKALQYWTRINKARRTPGHCARCGRPHAGPLRQCDTCREYHRKHKAEKRVLPVKLAVPTLEALLRRVASLETAVARLQLSKQATWKNGYDAGHRRGRGIRARNHEGLCGEHSAHMAGCVVSAEELRAMNHAYTGGHE
jgi:hypothetical protein